MMNSNMLEINFWKPWNKKKLIAIIIVHTSLSSLSESGCGGNWPLVALVLAALEELALLVVGCVNKCILEASVRPLPDAPEALDDVDMRLLLCNFTVGLVSPPLWPWSLAIPDVDAPPELPSNWPLCPLELWWWWCVWWWWRVVPPNAVDAPAPPALPPWYFDDVEALLLFCWCETPAWPRLWELTQEPVVAAWDVPLPRELRFSRLGGCPYWYNNNRKSTPL